MVGFCFYFCFCLFLENPSVAVSVLAPSSQMNCLFLLDGVFSGWNNGSFDLSAQCLFSLLMCLSLLQFSILYYYSIIVKRYYTKATLKESILIELAYSFRELVLYHSGVCGDRLEGKVLRAGAGNSPASDTC